MILWSVSAINSPHEAFLQVWWGKFFEAYKSRFPDDALVNADFNKVLTMDLFYALFMLNLYEILLTKCLISKFSGHRDSGKRCG